MAYTSPNMGLRVWNLLADPYDHDQLADNMARIDFHDHSPGRGHQIPTEAFLDGAITSAKLGNAATVKAVGAFSAYRNGALAAVATGSELVFEVEEFDLSGWYDTGNGRFTPQVAGYYRVSVLGTISTDITAAATAFAELGFTKNGTVAKFTNRHAAPSTYTADIRVGGTAIIACNGTTDYISVKTSSSVNLDFVVGNAPTSTYFQGELIGRS